MDAYRKNGGGSPTELASANLLSQRLTMLEAIRGTPRPFEVEPKPHDAGFGGMRAPATVFRSAHSVRSRRVDPGTMSWHELQSPLPEESAEYLAALLGNDVATADHGGGGCYSTILCDGLHVAGVTHTAHHHAHAAGSPAWNTFVRVPSVDIICHIALSKGGSVRVEPSGILGLDRRAVIADPTGATLTIIAGGDDRRTVGAGALGWDELRSLDPMESVRFWGAVFKWTAMPLVGPAGAARESQGALFLNGGVPVASVQRANDAEPSSRWLPVATVRRDLFDGTMHKAMRAGARVRVAPQPHALLTRLAIVLDPTGAEIAIGAEPSGVIAAA